MNSSRKPLRIVLLGNLVASIGILSACGGGSSGPAGVAPSGLAYPAVPAFVINQKITDISPTVTGSVTKYSVGPSLPAGLILNTTTGTISGTPIAVTPTGLYTITAANGYGTATAKLSLVVNDTPPSITYLSPHYSFTNGVSGQTDTPQNSGGKTLSWSVSPQLPAGLAFDSTTGAISGVATAASPSAPFAVTATNSGGNSTATLNISVAGKPLVDLGHSSSIGFIRFLNSRLLSQDSQGHWALWNFAADTILASGNSPMHGNLPNPVVAASVDMAGPTVVIQTSNGLEIRAAADGHVLAEITATVAWWRIASDGSYVCAGNSSGLTAWSTAGQALFFNAGDYSQAVTFAAPTQAQVALGPAGATVIQTVAIPTGIASVSPPFLGAFQSWFVDGGRFLSALGATVWVYSSAAVQQEIVSVAATNGLAGQGNWFWTFANGSLLSLYAIGSNSQPTASYNLNGSSYQAIASGNTLGLIDGAGGAVEVVDLSGASPVETSYTVPIINLSNFTAYAAVSSSSWIVGSSQGVLADGSNLPTQARFLDYGRAWSIAGSAQNVAIATASGRILYYDLASNTLLNTINFLAGDVSLSTDGSVLAAGPNSLIPYTTPDKLSVTLNVYSMPAATPLNSFMYTPADGTAPQSFSLSGSGTVLGEILYPNSVAPGSTCGAQAIAATGGSTLWCDKTGNVGEVQLSPDGSTIGASPPYHGASPSYQAGVATNLYRNGTLTTAVTGWVVGWLDNSRLLTIERQCAVPSCIETIYVGSNIYDSSGTKTSSPALPELLSLQAISSTSVFGRSPGGTFGIYSEVTGAALSLSGSQLNGAFSRGPSAVGGSEVVFQLGNLVLAEPY
jgi:hypothetical protein